MIDNCLFEGSMSRDRYVSYLTKLYESGKGRDKERICFLPLLFLPSVVTLRDSHRKHRRRCRRRLWPGPELSLTTHSQASHSLDQRYLTTHLIAFSFPFVNRQPRVRNSTRNAPSPPDIS